MFLLFFCDFFLQKNRYETTNGIKVRQTSYMNGPYRVVNGYYSYVGPDGKIYTTHYTADQNGYRATGSHLPVQDTAVQPLPNIQSTPGPGPYFSSTPPPFISSTPPGIYTPSTAFGSPSPYNDVPSSTPYRGQYQAYNSGYSPTTVSPIVSSSTPFVSTTSPYSATRRPHFPVYGPPPTAEPFRGYDYTNPKINSPYAVVSQQTQNPVFISSEPPINRFPFETATSSNINSRITTTVAPPSFANDFNGIPSSTISPFGNEAPGRFKEYVPPNSIVASTPRPFNSFLPNQPDTVFITPRPSFNQPRLPNSLSINQNLLPPYLAVGPLNSSPGSQNIFRDNANFIGRSPLEFNEPVRPLPQSVAPLTVTNLNYRKK